MIRRDDGNSAIMKIISKLWQIDLYEIVLSFLRAHAVLLLSCTFHEGRTGDILRLVIAPLLYAWGSPIVGVQTQLRRGHL